LKIKRVFASAVKNKTLELLVYGEIGEQWWSDRGITAQWVSDEINAAGDFDRIAVRINSPGGSCFEGVAIYNRLRAEGKPVDVFVDGLAASAASVIAMAGDTISVGLGAMIMIHNAWSFAAGDGDELRKVADTLDKISVTIGTIYVDRSKNDAATIKQLMDAETWMDAETAVEKGFADAVVTPDSDESEKARALARDFNLKGYKHVPKALQRKPKAATTDCECDCEPCLDGDCADCEMDPCTSPGCTCPQHEEMNAPVAPSMEYYERRLTLHERG
jgi:ATP-dependent protease ClpP protease subunit